MLDKTPSKSKSDRGVVHVETIGYKQDGTIVCIFRRKVMVPNKQYIDARGGEQPGRPDAGSSRGVTDGAHDGIASHSRRHATSPGTMSSTASSSALTHLASIASSAAASSPPTTAQTKSSMS